ncbi:MAG: integrin alpha [Planctomycetota bacterium]
MNGALSNGFEEDGAVAFVSGRTLRLILPPVFGHLDAGLTFWVHSAGDFNGDGTPDALRGSVFASPTSAPPDVRVYSGVDGSTLHIFPDPGVDDWGAFVAPLGDVDQDGFDDVILGEEFGDDLYVYGGPDGHLIRSHADLGSFRPSARRIGNVDGDGVPDYAIGLIGQNRVLVISGATGAVIHDILGQGQFPIGLDVCGVGDFDGDGIDDFATGATLGPNSSPAPGEVFVYRGSTGEVAYRFQGENGSTLEYANFGQQLDGGQDVNGDGVPDLIVSAPWPANGVGDPGYINVYSLRTGTLLWSRRRRADAAEFLWYPRLFGDLDGDGRSEWGFGDLSNDDQHFGAGRIWVYRGAPGDAEEICVGAPNSTGNPARLLWNGPTRVGDERMTLSLEDGPPDEMAVVFYGVPQAPVPAFDGTLCLARPAFRLTDPLQLDAAGAATVSVDWTSGPQVTPGISEWEAGATWAVQAVYLDPGGPGGSGLNTTSAWRVVLVP